MRVTAGDVLVQIQRLLGEPAGAYYDLRFRLQLLNQAQHEMVQDAVAAVREIEIPLTGGDVYLPDDFVTFAKQRPYYRSEQGHDHELTLYDAGSDEPRGEYGEPRFLIVDGSSRVRLSPDAKDGTLVVSYVPRPDTMWDEDDEIFGGDPMLSRFSLALAYKVAATELMALAPPQAQNYLQLYNQEMRRMRESRRSSPGHHQTVRGVKFYRS